MSRKLETKKIVSTETGTLTGRENVNEDEITEKGTVDTMTITIGSHLIVIPAIEILEIIEILETCETNEIREINGTHATLATLAIHGTTFTENVNEITGTYEIETCAMHGICENLGIRVT